MEVFQQTIIEVQQAIDGWMPTDREITVLEAGCGSLADVDFGSRSRVVGIDIRRNNSIATKGGRQILGDLETYPIAEDAYDAIVCWYVFEHLRRPDLVLDKICPGAGAGWSCGDRRAERAEPQGTGHEVHPPPVSRLDLPAPVPRSERRSAGPSGRSRPPSRCPSFPPGCAR